MYRDISLSLGHPTEGLPALLSVGCAREAGCIMGRLLPFSQTPDKGFSGWSIPSASLELDRSDPNKTGDITKSVCGPCFDLKLQKPTVMFLRKLGTFDGRLNIVLRNGSQFC